MKASVAKLGKKGTAKLRSVDVGTIRRWFNKIVNDFQQKTSEK